MINAKVKLLKKEQVAEGTMSFAFEKPPGFTFSPGQWIYLGVLNATEPDERRHMRQLSVASAPHEEYVMIATRIRDSGFKKHLAAMPIGEEAQLRGAFGTMTLHQDASVPAVFLAGGIGITPFRSMALHATHEKLQQKLYLFYANKTPSAAPFLQELKEAETQNPNIKFIPVMSQDNEWHGEKGYITIEMIQKYVPDASKAHYYITGPTAMTDSMNDIVLKSGIPGTQITFEQFIGY